MKKTLVLIIFSLSALLCSCGVGPFTETMYVEEPTAEPTPSPAPEFAMDEYYSAEEMNNELQFVEYSHGYAGFQIFLPQDWYFEVLEWDEESRVFGLDFWPSGSGNGSLRLRCSAEPFGVCGTGLVEVEGELPGTGKLRVGYYDGREYPSFIVFYDSPATWVLTNDMGNTWNANSDEIKKILGSLVLDPGAMRVSEAEKLALENCDVSHDYLRTEFEHESGNIIVEFVRMGSGGGTQAAVSFEKYGDDYIVIKDE